jgi:glycerol-3-phosphate dehydrogenase
MATRRSARILRPLLYTVGAAGVGGGILYVSYRPRDIPGSEAAAVPPPTYGEGGIFRPPNFPGIKSREEQIADLKRSSGTLPSVTESAKSIANGISTWFGSNKILHQPNAEKGEEEPYDLLVIGGGATGTGIALDAATRGLKVALVERDDFSSGTSSKSTKLVHGGVRYLEKAVWELDYAQ